MKLRVYLTLFLAALVGHPTYAAGEGEHGGEHEYHENVAAFFVGFAGTGSRDEGRREEGLALGLEYESRLNAAFGVGALAEYTFGDIKTWVFAVPFAYHSGPWKFYVAPGIEDSDEGSESLVRLGGEYGFEKGDWEISPQVDVDFVDGEKIFVIGVTFGRGF